MITSEDPTILFQAWTRFESSLHSTQMRQGHRTDTGRPNKKTKGPKNMNIRLKIEKNRGQNFPTSMAVENESRLIFYGSRKNILCSVFSILTDLDP